MTLSTVNVDDDLSAEFSPMPQAMDGFLPCATPQLGLSLLPNRVMTRHCSWRILSGADISYIRKIGTIQDHSTSCINGWRATLATPRTGQVYGKGVRISPFVFDASLRRLQTVAGDQG